VTCAVVLVASTLAACSSGSVPEAEPTASAGTETTTGSASEAAWAAIDDALSELGPEVGFLAAEVAPDGTCAPVHEVAPSTMRPMASQFKLFVLGALADRIAAGTITWDQALTVDDATRSVGNAPESGSLQFAETGTTVSVEEAATKMISISDNTATDMLIGVLGRDEVEARAGEWMADASANEPFPTTREMVLLHYVEGLGDRYLATPQEEREAFLASSVDPLPLGDIGSAYTTEPRFIETIEWFASPDDVCRAFAGLLAQAQEPTLASTLPAVLSHEVAGIGLEPSTWPTVWYKGGSEPGVLTLGWLATTDEGETFVVEAMVSDPDAALAPDSITDLVGVARDAFALLDRAPG
jgi:hypothetical protein